MLKHWKYFCYILRHKIYVLLAGRRLGVGWWQLLIHDLSKFLPSEWFPYADYFYGKGNNLLAFNYAWLKHQHRNPHHWQYWVLREDSGAKKLLEIPEKYLREMIADWSGAGMAINGNADPTDWYIKNMNNIKMNDDSREKLHVILDETYHRSVVFRAIVERLLSSIDSSTRHTEFPLRVVNLKEGT